MRTLRYLCRSALASLVLLLISSAAASAQTRTWVSAVGSDANPCSRLQPCLTFAGALAKTNAGGIINVVDNGGYGPVTINKSITIQSEGSFAGILLSAGSSGIIINAGDKDSVILRGLSIDGQGIGGDGIRFMNGLSLTVENCEINRVTEKGINFSPLGKSQLFVKDTVIRNNNFSAGAGILIQAGDNGFAEAAIDHVRIERNAVGIEADNHSKVSISNSEISRNSGDGVRVFSTINTKENAVINLAGSMVTLNGDSGLKAEGAGSMLRVTYTSIFSNGGTGINPISGGVINSFGTNSNAGNNPDGAPTPPALSLQ
jgi:hypothetical protein